MGLRETKTQRTKDSIVDAALELFRTAGYSRTTIEQIADAAEVGTTTVYRYFPNKDAIVLDPFVSRVGRMAEAVDRCDPSADLAVALGSALQAFFESDPDREASEDAAHAVIEGAPGPRARLWDLAAQEQALLEDAVGRRLGLDPDDVAVALACRNTLFVAALTNQRWMTESRHRSKQAIAAELIDAINASTPVVPELPSA